MKTQISLRSLRSFAARQFRGNSYFSVLLCVPLRLCGCLLLIQSAFAATNDLTSALQKGLFEEEANHNYPAAIEAYQSVINRFDEDRKLAATAIFRVGEIYRKQGKTNEANAQYERVVREFSDQSTLATLSQSYLAPLSKNAETAANPSESAPTSDEAEEVRKIRAMIRDSPDLVNAKDVSGNSRLYDAASLGHLVVARFLIENGADVNAQNHVGQAPLHIAAVGGHKALVELLLAHGANVHLTDGTGSTPLHGAARKGFRSIIEVLLAHGADVNAKTAWQGSTPLHLAVAHGFKSIAELLISHQADVNAQTSDVRDEQQHSFTGTPLDIAAERNDQPLAELLLTQKADPNATNNVGDTPLHIAARGNLKLTELLLASKAGVDLINNYGETPLALAAGAGSTNVIAALLSHGADINARNPMDRGWKGWTPLIYAVSASRISTTDLLLKNRADPNVKTENQSGSWAKGFTPLLMACSISGMADTVASLLDAKADPNAVTDFGLTPARAALKLSVISERKRVISLLLDHGADIESRDEHGFTLLMLAAENKDKEIVELLLARKADVSARNQGGLTALHLAVISQSNPSPMPIGVPTPIGVPPGRVPVQRQNESDATPDIVEALLAAGANPNIQSSDGKTALNYLYDRYNIKNRSLPQSALGPVTYKVQELLLAHGAVFDLPRLDAIEVRRPTANYSRVIFTKGTNGWDQFTLFDLIGVEYQLLSGSPSGESRSLYGDIGSGSVGGSASFVPHGSEWAGGRTVLGFPNFARIRVRHPKADFRGWNERTVDVYDALTAGECSVDVSLELGDQVEIPEADHVLNANWEGLSKPILATLKKCLTRQISIIVKGQTNNITLAPDYSTNYNAGVFDTGGRSVGVARVRANAPFMIKPALGESQLLLASSDLTRIKLIRADPTTGQKRELIVDCSPGAPAPSVWLRDGDVIEVPDRP
jgi:ankyrin repeat protein